MHRQAIHGNRTEIRRDDAEVAEPVDRLKLKALERSKAGEQALDECLRDADVVELELLESREKKHGDLGEIAGQDAGDAQRGRGAVCRA